MPPVASQSSAADDHSKRKPKTTSPPSSSDENHEMGSHGGTPSPIKAERQRSTRQSRTIPRTENEVENPESHHDSEKDDDQLNSPLGRRRADLSEDEASDDLNLGSQS